MTDIDKRIEEILVKVLNAEGYYIPEAKNAIHQLLAEQAKEIIDYLQSRDHVGIFPFEFKTLREKYLKTLDEGGEK